MSGSTLPSRPVRSPAKRSTSRARSDLEHSHTPRPEKRQRVSGSQNSTAIFVADDSDSDAESATSFTTARDIRSPSPIPPRTATPPPVTLVTPRDARNDRTAPTPPRRGVIPVGPRQRERLYTRARAAPRTPNQAPESSLQARLGPRADPVVQEEEDIILTGNSLFLSFGLSELPFWPPADLGPGLESFMEMEPREKDMEIGESSSTGIIESTDASIHALVESSIEALDKQRTDGDGGAGEESSRIELGGTRAVEQTVFHIEGPPAVHRTGSGLSDGNSTGQDTSQPPNLTPAPASATHVRPTTPPLQAPREPSRRPATPPLETPAATLGDARARGSTMPVPLLAQPSPPHTPVIRKWNSAIDVSASNGHVNAVSSNTRSASLKKAIPLASSDSPSSSTALSRTALQARLDIAKTEMIKSAALPARPAAVASVTYSSSNALKQLSARIGVLKPISPPLSPAAESKSDTPTKEVTPRAAQFPSPLKTMHEATLAVSSRMINLLLVEISSNVQNACLRGYELAIAHGSMPFKHEIERVIMELGGTLLSVTSPVFEQVASVPDRRYIIFPATHRVDDEVFDRHIATGHLDVVHFLEMVIKLRGEERDKQRLDVQANEAKMSNAVTKLQSQLEEVQARLVIADGAREEYRLNLAAEKASKDKLGQASDSQAKADRHRIAELQTSVDDLSTRLVELGDARSRETQSSNARIDGIREKARIEIDRLNVKIKEMSETHFELAKAKEAAERRAGNPLTAVSRRIVAQESVPPMPEFRPDDRQAASSLSRQNGNEGRSNPIFSLSKSVSISIGSNGHSERHGLSGLSNGNGLSGHGGPSPSPLKSLPGFSPNNGQRHPPSSSSAPRNWPKPSLSSRRESEPGERVDRERERPTSRERNPLSSVGQERAPSGRSLRDRLA